MAETPKPTRELIAKMRDAAGALQDATRIHFGDDNPGRASQTDWSPVYLRRVADQWESDLDADDRMVAQIADMMTDPTRPNLDIAQEIVRRFNVLPKGAKG